MSSRLFRGGTSEAVPMQWRPVGGQAPAIPRPHAPATPDPAFEAQLQAAFARGVAQGESTAQQRAQALTAPVVANLGAAVRQLLDTRKDCRQEAEQAAVKLSIAIARRILHREIATDPEAILGLVRTGLDRIQAREMLRLRLSPADAQVVLQNRSALGLPPAVEIQPDPSLPAGGAVFETTRGEFDASAQTQLTEIERGFTDLLVRRQG